MHSKSLFSFSVITLLLLGACGSSQKEEATDDSSETQESQAAPVITLNKLEGSPEYQDASLQLVSPALDAVDTGSTAFSFAVENYELGVQTEGAGVNGLANSGKGQHIHLIVDNGPYSAHYEPNFEKELTPGSHVVLAFLSRSYHESVKNPNAFAIRQFNVGGAEAADVDFTAPHMFYSRPKGIYAGADTKKLMLDFYLVNTDLSPDGNKVRATINGSEFLIDEWAPHVIEGLPMGEVTIKLELIDASGNGIPGPFNTVERTVTLEE